jgi:hypothetical protein
MPRPAFVYTKLMTQAKGAFYASRQFTLLTFSCDRSATQDESSRLRQRVAELEGVIREVSSIKLAMVGISS